MQGAAELANSPGLLAANLIAGLCIAVASYRLGVLMIRKAGVRLSMLVATLLVAAAYSFYFPGYDWSGYYKEAEIPDGQFAHMLLRMVFWPQPLIAIVGLAVGIVRGLLLGVRGSHSTLFFDQ